MLLGLNIGHDSSVVLADESGRILFASSEERLTRVKGEESYPEETLARLFDDESIFNIRREPVSAVCIGTFGELKSHRIHGMLTALYQAQSNYYRHNMSLGLLTEKPKPGHASWTPWMSNQSEPHRQISTSQALEVINQHLSKFNIESPVHFIRHHDAHAASGFYPSGFNDALVISLDGQGDGESGQIGHGTSRGIEVLARIPAAHSLGHVYSAVTNRYGFKVNRHEGKITGLAAYGDASILSRNLEALVRVEQGIPDIDPIRAGLVPELREAFDLAGQYKTDLLRVLVEQWDSASFADLASAVQHRLENAVIQIVDFWFERLGPKDVAVSGGVFANVALNRRIAEHVYPYRVYVYPNMGDGGLSAGAVWSYLSSRGQPLSRSPHESMLCGFAEYDSWMDSVPKWMHYVINSKELTCDDCASTCAKLLSQGFVIGRIAGRAEFGPRALGNRSIFADPRPGGAYLTLNKRLRRTEFMPFAPIAREEDGAMLFDFSRHAWTKPFEHMTMCAAVREEWRGKIPGIVHIDNSARPQLVSFEVSPFCHELLSQFSHLTGVPVLVNTSFNRHEEPIVQSLADGLSVLLNGGVDFLLHEDSRLFWRIDHDNDAQKLDV